MTAAPAPPAAAPAHAARGALHGLRVVEFAGIGPAPMACMLLADMGADVVRIDRLAPGGLGLPLTPASDVHARSRRSIALDLKSPDGRELAWRLLDGADVLVEGFRPGVMESLGLGPEPVAARCPRLVYGRMTGWGQHGPLAPTAGHDLNYLALTGALAAIGTGGGDGAGDAGTPEGRPLPPLNLVGDYGGGAMFLAFGVLAALWERERSGRGQVVDAAMVDGVAALAGLFHGLRAAGTWTPRRHDNLLDGGAPFYDCYRCACGGFVALAALEPKFFAEFARLAGLDAAWVPRQYERAAWPALREAIAAVIASGTRAHWAALFEGSDACVAPVLSFDEAPAHAHALARGAYVALDGVAHPAPAPRLSRSGAVPPRAAPQPGAHTAELLAEIGVHGAAAEALFAQGVVR